MEELESLKFANEVFKYLSKQVTPSGKNALIAYLENTFCKRSEGYVKREYLFKDNSFDLITSSFQWAVTEEKHPFWNDISDHTRLMYRQFVNNQQ